MSDITDEGNNDNDDDDDNDNYNGKSLFICFSVQCWLWGEREPFASNQVG